MCEAITVIAGTLTSSGSRAIYRTASATWRVSMVGSALSVPSGWSAPPEFFRREAKQRGHGRFIGHIGGHGQCNRRRGGQGDGLDQGLPAPPGQRDRVALAEQRQRDGAADAAAGSGHHGDAIHSGVPQKKRRGAFIPPYRCVATA